jgi:hypothetical protein
MAGTPGTRLTAEVIDVAGPDDRARSHLAGNRVVSHEHAGRHRRPRRSPSTAGRRESWCPRTNWAEGPGPRTDRAVARAAKPLFTNSHVLPQKEASRSQTTAESVTAVEYGGARAASLPVSSPRVCRIEPYYDRLEPTTSSSYANVGPALKSGQPGQDVFAYGVQASFIQSVASHKPGSG